jgi:hypothetical protein
LCIKIDEDIFKTVLFCASYTYKKMSTQTPLCIFTSRIILIFFVFLETTVYSQKGCTDTFANNYDPSATINDGSCTYNAISYNPPVVVDPINDTLFESSGLQWVNGSLWSFNDRNGTPDLYRIDTASKAILQTVRLKGASNVDWEEVSYDGTYFYVGDFGNNLNGARTDLKIYKFPYSAIPGYRTNPKAAIDSNRIEVISFRYSDQPQPPVPGELNTTKFDCEAMIVNDGKIHLFTKNWISDTSTHYVINSTSAGEYIATPVDTLVTGYLVTGATKAPGKDVIVLLGYLAEGLRYHFMHLLYGYNGDKYFSGNKRKINLPPALDMGQAEGITFRNDHYGYISNERVTASFGSLDITVNQKLRSFNTDAFVPPVVLSLELKEFSVNRINAQDKIVWHFYSPVHDMNVEHSLDGIHFITLKTYSVSTGGSFLNTSFRNILYYRISWKADNGEIRYSKIIAVENKESSLISNVVLKTGGELSFVLGGSREESFSFKLLSIDGKELSQVSGRSYKPGFNKVNFGCSVLNNVVLVTAFGSRQKTTFPIFPGK